MQRPDIQLIGDTLAVRFEDQFEAFFDGPRLRANSPSAERIGEADLFGNIQGGEREMDYSRVKLINWQWVGGYAIRLYFSDGHSSGLFSFKLLRELAEEERASG